MASGTGTYPQNPSVPGALPDKPSKYRDWQACYPTSTAGYPVALVAIVYYVSSLQMPVLPP